MLQVSRESPESFSQNVQRTWEAPDAVWKRNAREGQNRGAQVGADETQLEGVSQSGDSPGGAGTESKTREKQLDPETEPLHNKCKCRLVR